MAVACIALFVALGGTSIAAVNYARNAGSVDGRSAVRAGVSNARAAGKLVATNKIGPEKGRIPGRFLADVARTQPFGRAFEVPDNSPGAAVPIGSAGGIGTLTASCNDQRPAVGVEDPVSELNFVNGSGEAINIASRVGVRDDGTVALLPNGGQAQLRIAGSNTFRYHVELRGTNLLVQGVVRQDGAGTGAANCLVYGTVMEIS